MLFILRHPLTQSKQFTLGTSGAVIATLSKTADNKLKEGEKPVVALIDGACQSMEHEHLLIWVHDTAAQNRKGGGVRAELVTI